MKKILKLIIVFIAMFITNVYAASGSISVSSSASQIIVNNKVTVYVTVSSSSALGSWEYTLNYDNSIFKLASSDVGLHYASYASGSNTKSVTYKYVFTALKSGTCNFYVDSSSIVGWDESVMSVNNGSKKVKSITYAEYQESLSKNNNLKNISVDGYNIEPEFNKDTLEYKVEVSEDTKEINIIATPEDKTASITGAGKQNVSAGTNQFDILVIAENGSEKKYKLSVEVIDKNPIEVVLEGKKYNVVKIKENLEKPTTYNESTITIEEFEIPAFYSDITEFTLVGLKSEDGKVELYIYDNGKYIKYNELNFGNIIIYPLPDKLKTIKNYQSYEVELQNIKLNGLKINKTSRNIIIYGLNVETKEEGFYQIDTKDNTAIKYNTEEIDIYQKQNQLFFYVAIVFGVTTLISIIGIICLLNKKKYKKISKSKDNDKSDKPKSKTKDKETPKDN